MRNFIEFMTGVKATQKLPTACLHKPVLSMALKILMDNLGNRVTEDWVRQWVPLDGKISWPMAGLFSFEGKEGEVEKICKLNGNSVSKPAEANLKKRMVIESNFSDVAAGIHVGMLNLVFTQHISAFAVDALRLGNDAFKRTGEQAKTDYERLQQQAAAQTVQTSPSEAPKRKKNGAPKSSVAKRVRASSA